MSEKKSTCRSELQSFANQFYGKEFHQLGTTDQGRALTRFYVTEIHNRIASYISDEDLDYAFVDGPKDLGIDLIFRDDGVVHIFQCKYLSPSKCITDSDICHFQSIFERLADPRFRQNKALADKLSEIKWDSDNFILKFICLGKIEGTAKSQTVQPFRIPDKLAGLEDRVQVEYLDEGILNEELRCALTQTAGIPQKITIHTVGGRSGRASIIQVPSPEYPSYVLVVSAREIIDIYRKEKNRLFTFNIRNYIGSTSTNKGIIATARDNPAHFFHFNNGISCLAKTVEIPEEGKVITDGLQIINGAQTVKALANSASPTRSINSDACVLVRITAIGKYGIDGAFANEVTRYNNTQNVIKVSDFRSNDPIQIDLAEKFRKLQRNGKKVDYHPKRTDSKRAQSITIRLEEFAKVCYCFLCDPVKFSGSTSFLFDVTDGGGYRHVFGDGSTVWTKMPDEEFKLRSSIWWMAAAFGERLKDIKKTDRDPKTLAALERKWFVIYAAKVILEQAFPDEKYRDFLIKNYEGNWMLGQGRAGEQFAKLFEAACGAVKQTYSMSSIQPAFSHRNWMRSLTTVDAIRSAVSNFPGYRYIFQ